jgi:hypothetical protein
MAQSRLAGRALARARQCGEKTSGFLILFLNLDSNRLQPGGQEFESLRARQQCQILSERTKKNRAAKCKELLFVPTRGAPLGRLGGRLLGLRLRFLS